MKTIGEFYDFILKKLKISRYGRVVNEMIFENYKFYDEFFREKQFEAYKISTETYYKIFKIMIFDEGDRITYKISTNKKSCLLLFHIKSKKTIYIEGVIYNPYEHRIRIGILKNYGGKELFKFAIKFIEKLGCVECVEIGNKVFEGRNMMYLPMFSTYMLLYGETWLERMGFTQYEQSIEIVIDRHQRNRDKNIIHNKKVKDIEQSIRDATCKSNISWNRLIEKYRNLTINKFFQLMMKKHNAYDEIIIIADEILKSMNVHGYNGEYVMYLSNGINLINEIDKKYDDVIRKRKVTTTYVDYNKILEEAINYLMIKRSHDYV